MKYQPALILVLAMLLVLVTGCSTPIQNKDNASTALSIALNYTDVKNDISSCGGQYSSDVQPADGNITGYLNYTGNLYRVRINVGNGGPPCPETFNILVDLSSGREVEVARQFDVATFPEQIVVPGHASWYRRFNSGNLPALNGVAHVYIEVNQSLMNESISPMLVDEDNFDKARQGMPFQGWSLYNLGENATQMIGMGNFSNGPVNTGLKGIIATPGKIVMPGLSLNGRGVELTFANETKCFYLILVNNGTADSSVEITILG